MTPIKSIYGAASGVAGFQWWLDLATEWRDIRFTARWPKLIAQGASEAPANCQASWPWNFEDIASADATLVVVPEDQTKLLRGALVEAGAALALGKVVVFCGPETHPSAGSWIYHPRVFRVPTLAGARELIELSQWGVGAYQHQPATQVIWPPNIGPFLTGLMRNAEQAPEVPHPSPFDFGLPEVPPPGPQNEWLDEAGEPPSECPF